MAKPLIKTLEPVIRKPLRKTDRVQITTGRGKTEQSHKTQCDINYILKDYQTKGIIRHANKNAGRYDDINVADFQEAMFLVKEAQQMFDDLPSQLRNKFGNDPAQFLGFVQNPDNADEMAELGLLVGNDGLDRQSKPSGAPEPSDHDPSVIPDNPPTKSAEP